MKGNRLSEFIKRTVFVLLSFLLINSCTQNDKGVVQNRDLTSSRDSLLDKYSFTRNKYDPDDLELLAGNSELGGLVSQYGLGFDFIWCSDLWANKEFRIPLQGVKLLLEDLNSSVILNYNQKQSLKNGIVGTEVHLDNGLEYESEIFFSANCKRMLVMRIKNISDKKVLAGKLRLPRVKYEYSSSWPDYDIVATTPDMFTINIISEKEVTGLSHDSLFTQGAWTLRSNKSLIETSENNLFIIELQPGDEQFFYFSFITDWQTMDFIETSRNLIEDKGEFTNLKKHHMDYWAEEWSVTPYLKLPDKKHEELFYQSVFWLFNTSGSDSFLPGESQFATSCWNMKPFTYGAAGWSTLAFMHLGHFEKAKKMLINHYKPEGLRKNVNLYINDAAKGKFAYSFAHEAQTDGTTTGTCDEQRHLNGFALALFHKYYILTGDTSFLNEYLYPVAKGVAEFWSDLAIWNDSLEAYIFPVLRSVSEDLFEKSLLDVVLSARWSLETAVHYANLLKSDTELKMKWNDVLKNLHIPQNDKYYLEFLGDNEERTYASYQGIRAPVYLGYPTCELADFLDTEKAVNTLEHAWQRNHRGEGMLGFIASWYSLSAQNYGLGNLALEMADQNFNCYDPSHTALCEGPDNLERYYFLTTTSSYLLFPLNMLIQNLENEIVPFPAVPETWNDIVFNNIPAAGGHKVSGKLKDGSIEFVQINKDSEIIYETTRRDTLKLDLLN